MWKSSKWVEVVVGPCCHVGLHRNAGAVQDPVWCRSHNKVWTRRFCTFWNPAVLNHVRDFELQDQSSSFDDRLREILV